MRITLSNSLLLFFSLLIFWSCSSNPKKQISIENFFNKADKSNFQLSPNGQYVSYLQKYKGVQNLYVMDLESDHARRVTSETDIGLRLSFWANDDELIVLKNREPGDSLRLMVVSLNDQSMRYLIAPSSARMRWLGPMAVNKRNEILIGLNDRDSSVFDAYRLNIIDGSLKMVDQNPGNIIQWLPDLNGEIKLAVESDGHTETILYRNDEKSDFKAIIQNNFRTSVQPLGFSSEKHARIFALSNENRDKKALVEINVLTGKEEQVLFSHDEVDISNGGYSVSKGVMDYAVFSTWKEERHFFNLDMENLYRKINESLPGYMIDLQARDTSYSRFLLRAYTDIEPGTYYFYDLKKDFLKELGKVNSAINAADLSPTKSISYTASDGTVINGYLTVPKYEKSSRLPVIVIPHNGPSSRTVWGYDAEVQFLVSRGFAVFQPNYRGSTGYGKSFWTAGFKQWGKKVQDDISEGVEWLIEEGIADPARIGIYGSNFGGYAALHAACFNSKVYSCAASYSGMTNLYTYLKEIPSYYTPYMKKYYDMVGDPQIDGDYLRSYSPVFHANKVQIPLFIAQGGKDNRNNVNETNHFVKELRKNGVNITYMLKEEEGNYFVNEDNNADFYRSLEDFFTKHLIN